MHQSCISGSTQTVVAAVLATMRAPVPRTGSPPRQLHDRWDPDSCWIFRTAVAVSTSTLRPQQTNLGVQPRMSLPSMISSTDVPLSNDVEDRDAWKSKDLRCTIGSRHAACFVLILELVDILVLALDCEEVCRLHDMLAGDHKSQSLLCAANKGYNMFLRIASQLPAYPRFM